MQTGLGILEDKLLQAIQIINMQLIPPFSLLNFAFLYFLIGLRITMYFFREKNKSVNAGLCRSQHSTVHIAIGHTFALCCISAAIHIYYTLLQETEVCSIF